MKIKRYFAQDSRGAMRQIREELGPDAVILSNRRMADGVEIVAAIDYDETAVAGRMVVEGYHGGSGRRPFAAPVGTNGGADEPARPEANRADGPVETRRRDAVRAAPADNFWSQDPLLREMRSDIDSVKAMLKQQLSAMAWGETARRHPHRAELIRRLIHRGFSAGLCKQIAERIDGGLEPVEVLDSVLEVLVSMLPVVDSDWLTDGGIFSLVGPTGVGKTTTTAKIAAQATMRYGHRQVALITIDNYRVGAYEQLRTYGRILDIPVRRAGSRQELEQAIGDFSGRRLLLIDTAGMCQHDRALAEQQALLGGLGSDYRSLLLLPATMSLAGLMDIHRAFAIFAPSGAVLTKLDEAPTLGGALSAVIHGGLPLVYACDGQKVPEDMQVARPRRLAERSLEGWASEAIADVEKEIVDMGCMGDVVNARY